MFFAVRIVHVLSLGLWFGMDVFFTFVVGLSLFHTFETLSEKPAQERPFWFRTPPELERTPPSERFPNPLRKEQGSRVAGLAVGPLFDWYFGIQAVCGLLALITAFTWWSDQGIVGKLRVVLLVVAMVGVAAGWYLERRVSDLRVQRSQTSDAVLTNPAATSEQIQTADLARQEFGRWHFYSLAANLGVVILTTVAMALAAALPRDLPRN